jgi:hypothetical protein
MYSLPSSLLTIVIAMRKIKQCKEDINLPAC